MYKKFCTLLGVLCLLALLTAEVFAAPVSTTVIPKPKPRPRPPVRQAPVREEREAENLEDIDARFKALLEQYPDVLGDVTNSNDIRWVTVTGNPVEAGGNQGTTYTDGPEGEEIPPEQLREIQKAQYWLDVKEDLELRAIDQKALELVKEFTKAEHAVHPISGQNGAITYVYGSVVPKVVCRPNRVTDIALQPGEKVTGVHAGDTVRWQISPAISGSGDTEIIHVIIKPLMPDISTNLLVMTDRRTYNINLVSSNGNYIPSLRFTYPQDVMDGWATFIAANKKKENPRETTLEPQYAMSAEDLYFGYKIVDRSRVPWKPIRVFDDGVKTYIQMPKRYRALEAPVVLFYEGKRQKLVNYRVKGTLYIVDRIMNRKAVMIAGKSKVVLVREKQ